MGRAKNKPLGETQKSYSVVLKRRAELDLDRAYKWYENTREDLGVEFLLEFDACVNQLLQHPLAASVVYRDARRKTMKRFPYKIVYRVKRSTLRILTVVHYSRAEKIWKRAV